jgi:hypothetical protein
MKEVEKVNTHQSLPPDALNTMDVSTTFLEISLLGPPGCLSTFFVGIFIQSIFVQTPHSTTWEISE